MKKNKVSIYCTDDVKKYVESESSDYGMSVSAFLNMLIADYKNGKKR